MNNIRMTDIKKKGTGDAKWKEAINESLMTERNCYIKRVRKSI